MDQAKREGCFEGPIELVIGEHRFIVKDNLTFGFEEGMTLALGNGYPKSSSLLDLLGLRVLGVRDSAIVVIIPGPEAALINRVLREQQDARRAAADKPAPEMPS